MMKNRLCPIFLAAVASVQGYCADDFSGFNVGIKAGVNRSDTSGALSTNYANAGVFGGDLGYNWTLDSFLLGVDGFYDAAGQKAHGTPFGTSGKYGNDVGGGDLKLGLPTDSWLPYVKLGYGHLSGTGNASSFGHGGFHGGIGAEYMFAPSWTAGGEWSTTNPNSQGIHFHSSTFALALNYYFGGASTPAPTPAPAVAPAPAPAPPPAPAPTPTPQPKVEKCVDTTVSKTVSIEGANFDTASAKLKSSADVKLQEVVAAAKADPSARFSVNGYTDGRGRKAYNVTLSTHRAESVKHYLVAHGVDASRIVTAGYGPEQPLGDNGTAGGRAQNRRVEIHYDAKEVKKSCSMQ